MPQSRWRLLTWKQPWTGETRLLGHVEAEQAQTAAMQAHSLEAQAYAHAEAQAHTIAHVQSLEAQAHAHAQQVPSSP